MPADAVAEDQFGAGRLGQAQAPGDAAERIRMRPAGPVAFQVADRADAQPSAFCQLFLRQPSRLALKPEP
jgi:hypothetical protein